MPNKITYTITTSDGKSHQVSEDNIKKYGMQSYADAYKGATIRMRDNDGADYDIPLSKYSVAQSQGLHPFRFEHLPAKPKNSNAGSHAQQVTDEYDHTANQQAKKKQNGGTRMTEAEKNSMMNWAANMQNELAASKQQTGNRLKYQTERAKNPLRVNRNNVGVGARPIRLGKNPNVLETELEYDPTTGNFEQKYITESGNEYSNRAAADLEQNQFDDAKTRALDPINTALRDAYAERDRIDELMRERMKEIDDENKGIGSFLREMAEASRQPGMTNPISRYQTDEQYRQLEAAARKNRAAIQTLEDKRDNKMNSFWHSAATTAANGYTFNDGLSEINDAIALMDAQKHVDSINKKRSEGKPLTKEEEAAEAVLRNEAANNAVQGQYSDDYGSWARAGMILPTSIDMMKDITLTPGATGIARGVAGKVAGIGGKYLVKETGEAAIKSVPKAIARGVLKATGIVLGAHTAGAVISNTAGLGRTVGAMGTNMAGETTIDDKGNIKNNGGMGFMEALADAERNQIRENGSEMFGEFLPGLGGVVTKGLDKLGLSKLTGALQNIGNKQWYQQYNALLKAGGYNGIQGEAIEEYEGIAFDALTGHTEDAWKQIKDPKTHIDIWLGCATMGALLGAVPMTIQGAHTAQYYRYKHTTDVADKVAGYRIGQDKWNGYRDRIDQTPNEKMADEVMGILNSDMQPEEKRAVLNYVRNLTKMRGFNIAQTTNSKEQPQDVQQANQSYSDGYNAQNDEEMQDIKNRYERNVSIMTAGLSIDENALDGTDWITEAQREASDGTEEGRQRANIILDYVNSKQAYDGMIQRMRDDIDSRVAESNQMVDSRTNKNTGMIQGATLKVQDVDGNDRKAYVLNGNLVMLSDGTGIDRDKSDGNILILHEDTGEMEMVSPEAILNVDEPIDPDTEKQTAAEAIRQQFAQEAANRIDGTVAFQPGDTYTVTDESGQAAQIQIVPNENGLADNGDGTVNVSSDGGQTVVPMRKEDIQAMVDATNRARVAQAEQQREAMQQPQAQGQPTEQPAYSLNDELTLLDENGNEVRGSITGDINEDGQYEVYTENPINGRKVNLFTADELNRMNANSAENSLQNGGISTGNGNNGAENILQSGNIEPQNIPAPVETLQANGETLQAGGETLQADSDQASALERIPKDEQGQPVYEQTDPDTAWDALLEQTNGDEVTAQEVADDMVADKESALKKLEKQKPKGGTTPAEKIAARLEQKRIIEQAQAELNHWQKIAQTSQRRRQAAMAEQSRQAAEAARLRREQEEQERAAREEAERIRREALNGVPDFVNDTPQDARARGYRRVKGEKVDRQQSIPTRQGSEVQVKFDDKNIPTGHVALIEASQLQPSHLNGLRNPLHFIDEAQPKERNDDASVMSARRIAANIRPEEITSSVTAYTGAPTVNTRGEVIQGNNRSAALREMWAGEPEQAAIYKQYLTDYAADFGLAPEDVEAMQQPVLVNMLDVADEDAINLGQFVAQDTESGGTERIKPKNIVQKMGDDMRGFAGRLLASPDEEMTFSELVDRNGMDVLKWMQAKNYITPTQYRSAFDSKGNLTAEAKNDLKGVMYQSIFQNGNTHLEEMFNALPAKAQKAILATAYRDYDSPNAERLNAEIQNSISAYYALSQDSAFANAKNYKEARMAAEAWKRQYALDDVTGESYLPSERYSNFALLLATMYKGQTQTFIQNTFNHIFDLVQGTQEATLFEESDNTPRSLVEAINETLSGLSDELLLNGNFIYNGQRRNNVLAGSGSASQQGGQGSDGSTQAGGRTEDGTGAAADNRGIESDSGERREDKEHPLSSENTEPRQITRPKFIDPRSMSDNERQQRGDMLRNAPAIDVEAGQIVSTKELSARKVAERWWDENVPEPVFYDTEAGEVEINRNSVESSLAHRYGQAKLDAITSLVEGFENAVYLGTLPDFTRQEGILSHYFAYPINYNEKRNYVFCRAMQDANKNRLYVHEVFVADNLKKGDTLQTAAFQPHGGIALYKDILSNVLEETSEPTNSRTDVDSNLNGVLDGTATQHSSDVSANKDTDKSAVKQTIGEKVAQAEAETNQNPTDGQKEAGNYKKGHVRIGQFDITVENPKGSVRRGTDQNGKPWETTMHNTYGYIRGTEGVDGDHIDVFLTDDIDGWNGRRVYVVDQYNEDGTFDEHKVMLGFNDEDDAREAYFSNYSEDWADNRKIVMTSTNLDDFEKWINSSHRKTKPFAEYKSVPAGETKAISPADRISEIDAQMADLKKQADEAHGRSDLFEEARIISESNELFAERRRLMQEKQPSQAEVERNEQQQEQPGQTEGRYTVEQRYHKKNGTYIYAVKFTEQMPREQFLSLKKRVKDFGGYYSSYGKGGFIFETEEAGRKFAEAVLDPSGEKLDDNKPLSLADMQQSSEPVMRQVDVEGLMKAINENGEAKLRDHLIVGRPGLTEKATGRQSNSTTQETEQQPAQEENQYGASNKLVSRERYEELKKRMRQKLGGQMNMGIDPEILAIGTEMAAYHIEAGARKFSDYARHMIDDLGDAIRPYLKSFYNGTRDLPEVQEAGLADEMTPYDDVRSFDVANFDKTTVNALNTAQMVVQEQVVKKQADTAKEQLISQRNQQRKKERQKKQEQPMIADLFSGQEEIVSENQEDIPFKKGDAVIYNGKPATVYDIEGGQLVLDTGLAPVLYESVTPKEVQRVSGKQVSSVDNKQAVSSQVKQDIQPTEQKQEDELSGDSADYQKRAVDEKNFVGEVAGEISYIASQMQYGGEFTPLTMTRVKKMLDKYDTLHDLSTTDIQELIELAMIKLTRLAAQGPLSSPNASFQRKGYENVVALYNAQPMLNARDSTRVERQQYSTPTPFGYVMGQFVRTGREVQSVLEPSAGNGALTIAFDPAIVHVNDIDDRRLSNLRTLNYGQVTGQNALLPFEGEQVDAMLTNPPFGSTTQKVYDDIFKISSLEGQMAINALDAMKDNGRAAIVIGGNTEYRENGIMKPKDMQFFGYLYSHYNVVDVINMDGEMYARNGTKYPVRIILIDGRKTGAFKRVIPPVKSKARAEQVKTFDELYNRIQDDILQLQQMGSETAGSNGEATATDRGTRKPDGSTNNRPNAGNGNEPLRTSERSRSTQSDRNTARTEHTGRAGSTNEQSTTARVDNGNRGNARGTDDVPQQPSTENGEQPSGNVANEPRRSGGTERRDTASQSGANGGRLAVSLTDEKVPYPNRSQSATLMSVVPANQAQVLAASLADIGDVDKFLVDSLGYSSKEELFSYLAAEQIDSVALAINQMSKGNGFIIGDMTGVGKGRQGAALIRYAIRQGKKPIYFTQKPALFADNYRDLCDIGSSNLRPFIIASSKDGVITDAKGNVVYKLPTKKEVRRVFDYIMQNGTLPDEYDYAITTYSQIQNGTKEYEAKGDEITEKDKSYNKGKTPAGDVSGQVRRDVIAALANDNYLILDESHTVGGQGGGAMFMQYLMPKISGVTFLSATFAKRPDNMPLYAMKTALSDSGMKPQEMIEAIAKGGVTLQEIMSKQLVQSGQMIRRERSFQGVNIDWLPVTEEADKVQRAQFDEVADIFNAIRSFQDDYIKPLVTQMSDDLAEQGSYSDLKRGTEAMGVKNTPFASKMYNLVNQLLFALKADAVADRTIWNLKHGFKPVISFTNTMEGFLEEAPKDTPMDEIPNFSLTLLRALDGVMRYQVTDADSNTTGSSFRLSDLSPEGQARYNEIRNRIMNLSANLPISPMDTIKIKIEEAGYTVGEITGRTTELIKDENGKYVVRNRTDKDKKAAARDFNNGKLDVLIINKSGSTGISLHSSPKFADQRQRVMVFAQFQQDISDEVQMRGRIDRTGQIYRGRYEYIVSYIPAEQRLQMMFKAKLKSLDANTTSSQKSKFNEMQVVDYLNKYGDEVTWQYMLEHPELSERLGDPLDMLSENNGEEEPKNRRGGENAKPQDGCAAKIARYLPFLPVAEQESVFKDITEAYQVKIQLLNDAGENDLEITTMPLRAETKKRSLWRRGTTPNSGNAFADNTYLEEVEVDVLKKPMKANEVKAMSLRLTDGKDFDQWRDEMHSKISQYYDQKATSLQEKLESRATERAEKQKEKYIKNARKARQDGKNTMTDDEIGQMAQEAAKTVIDEAREKASKQVAAIVNRKNDLEEVLDMFTPLQPLVIPLDLREDAIQTTFTPSYGTFVGFKFSKEYSPSTSTAIFATLDGRRKVELPLRSERVFRGIRMQSTMNSYSLRDINMDNWDSRVPTTSRRTAYIVTGNLLQALVDTEKDARTKGYLISYSTIDGDTRQGILMPERFQPNDLRNSVPISSRIHQIRSGEKVESEDGKVSVAADYGWRGGYTLRVPKSKQTGYKYFGDKELRKLVEKNEFETKGNSMVANVSDENLPKVLDRLSKLGVTVLQESKLTEVDDNQNDASILQRGGNGALTNDELSYENDPVAKMTGRSPRTAAQRRAFAERERQRMTQRVQELAEKLHLDNVDIVTDASTLQGRRAKAKGFYSRSTGRITIVIPNHASVYDAEQTLLHEAVAHYGLRELFGEHFDTFLDNVFQSADESVRRHIVELAEKRNWDFRTATEEYLASLAESTNFDNMNASWWQKIKELFLRMLHKIGFEDFSGVTLSDNELRYILWRSYENLAEPGRYRSILGEAEDVAKQNELKVGNYAIVNSDGRNVADNDLYRNSDTGTLRQRYDRAVRTPNKSRSVKWYESIPARLKESYVDSMRALHVLMKLISEETGNEIKGFEDAYKAENRMSSENKGQKEVYNRDFYKPLIEAVMNLIRNGATYEEVKRYAIAKHGLERNQDMAERDAEKDYEVTQKVHPHSKKTLQDFIDEYRKKDYSGLTALTETDNVVDAEAVARQIVSDFEGRHDTTALWDRINAATKETLRKSYDSGLMDKATYDKVRDMYQYYIPLRGWDCEVASNEYEYLMSGNHLMLSPVLQTAKGRTSLADDPFAVIGFMAENSIIQGNRNRMKQKFLNFVLNNPTDLVTVSEQWYVFDNATGKWEPRNPIIPEDATGDEVDAILEQHEQDMKALGDKATKKRSGLQLDMHITKREGQEHVVKVKRGGKEYCLYINGNPRAAQALNGITNPDVSDSKMRKAAQWLKNFMAQMFTSKNPTFIFRNMIMDAMWAGTAVAIKENKDYVKKYTGNITRAMLKAKLPQLLAKFQNGTLDKDVEIERYFDEFIRNGGETGFTQLNTVENYKRDIKRFVKEAQGRRNIPKKAWDGLWDGIEFMNRSAEDTTRFMVYMTSRQMGRDVARSVWDAKEITVNFNKKGSGGLGADMMNFCYIFFNAAIQSMANFGRLMYHHPAKTMAALTLFSSAGFIVPMMNLAIIAASGGDDDDDDNAYWDLPEWVRRSNIVLYIPFTEKGFITIPLSHELRPFYGMGEIAFSCLMGKENPEEALKKAAAGFSGMSPVDLTGNGGNIAVNMTPTIGQPFAQIIANTDYFGKPIYRRSDWNELDPEWTKAYKGTSSWLVDGTRWLNEFTGGDNVESGTIDWNPAIIEHLFEGYFGGMGKTLNKAQKTLEMMWNEDMREWRNVPIMSSFYQDGDVRTAGSQLNREYYEIVEEMKETEHLFSGYKKQIRMGAAEYGEKLDELVHSEVFKRYRLVKGYNNAIRKLTDAMERVDPTKRKDVETAILNLKVEMFEKLQELNKIKEPSKTRK